MKTTYQQRQYCAVEEMKKSLNTLERKHANHEPFSVQDFIEANVLRTRALSYGINWIVYRVEKMLFIPNGRNDAGAIITKGGKADKLKAASLFSDLFRS